MNQTRRCETPAGVQARGDPAGISLLEEAPGLPAESERPERNQNLAGLRTERFLPGFSNCIQPFHPIAVKKSLINLKFHISAKNISIYIVELFKQLRRQSSIMFLCYDYDSILRMDSGCFINKTDRKYVETNGSAVVNKRKLLNVYSENG
ncbi:MAG: hypothetical protein ACE3JK_10905 [Sporolactobacillus sp.]